MNYLSAPEIRRINERVLIETGGLSNAAGLERTEGSVDYLVSKVKGSLYGEEIYDTVFRKAAYYALYVIRHHPFVDGNKRVGAVAAIIFLYLNGHKLDAPPGALHDFVMALERGERAKAEAALFLREHGKRR